MSGRTRTQGATQAPHQTLVHVKLDQIEGSNQSQIEIQARIHEHQVERITRWKLGVKAGQTSQAWKKSVARMQGK
ncbi:hypothetical protein HanXRQr2_Chr12g0548511 [Helianthus annuus]|uniref:Uncharacterized protein n=1 Tax=Helianthus annuus TaxID=4232 RepID=A0A9K3MWQ3_HELAN|nr:hypothetical protein HanXRQr2_Chr12g0548511 [Helianthus annuus]KAJ0932983.1 hypothetical protein HanPSC8_Chr04g0179881 [Helianthus annuus]KAJ0932984.1 hypothetical protein HanPSC8_Chr04g0179891 [Helianthus annuus]